MPPPRSFEPEPEPEAAWEGAEDDYDDYEDERAYAPPPPPRWNARDGYPEPRVAPEPVYRARRAAGVLHERDEDEFSSTGTRLVALVGGAVIAVMFIALVAVLVLTGDDGGGEVAGTAPDETPTSSRAGTVIAVGSPGASRTAVTATGTASGTPATGTPSPGASPTGTITPAATATSSQPTPTSPPATATPTPLPPTATPIPPTATPEPPTPTPTVALPAHPLGYAECTGGSCGNPPLLVVCAPGGWFVDVGRNYPNPGWPTREVIRVGDAATACDR